MSLIHLINKIKSEKAYFFGIPISMHYALLILTALALFYGMRSWSNRDKWVTLVHAQYGFSVDYPANWKQYIYGETGSHNLHDLKAEVSTNVWGSLGAVNKRLWIYRMPLEEPTLFRASQWGAEKLARHETIATDLQETQIGTDDYPALTRTFQYANSSEVRIHYYVIHHEDAYLLEFYLRNVSDQEEALPILARMLASFHLFD